MITSPLLKTAAFEILLPDLSSGLPGRHTRIRKLKGIVQHPPGAVPMTFLRRRVSNSDRQDDGSEASSSELAVPSPSPGDHYEPLPEDERWLEHRLSAEEAARCEPGMLSRYLCHSRPRSHHSPSCGSGPCRFCCLCCIPGLLSSCRAACLPPLQVPTGHGRRPGARIETHQVPFTVGCCAKPLCQPHAVHRS